MILPDPLAAKRLSAISAIGIRSGPRLLDDLEDLAPSRHAVTPDAIEIGDERLDLFRADQCLRLSDIGKLVKGVVDRGIAFTPAPPTALRPEDFDCPRQMIGRVPMVEQFPVGLVGYLGAHDKTAFGHRVLPLICLVAIIAGREAAGRYLPHPASTFDSPAEFSLDQRGNAA